MKSFVSSLLFTFALLLCLQAQAQQHGHLYVGAIAKKQGEPCFFSEADNFHTRSGYVKTLTYTNANKFANLYQGNITLTALHSADLFEEAGAAPGAFLVAEIVSVSGPVGGAFGLWETNSTTAPAFNIPTGTTNGAFRFDVSDPQAGAGQPDADAFGHIHGRRFSATQPGLYTVGIRILDVSTNGTGGGPIHLPSEVMPIYFQAGHTIREVILGANTSRVTFGTETNYLFTLQASTQLTHSTSWTNIATVIGTDYMKTIDDPAPASSAQKFYRVKVVPK